MANNIHTIDPARQSFNNGYWDGWHDLQAGRELLWDDGKHPNQDYLAGYNYGIMGFADGAGENCSIGYWFEYQSAKMEASVLRQMFK